MELVTTRQGPVRLLGRHGAETYGTLWAFVDPTAFFAAVDLASARGAVRRLGPTTTGFH